jgi:ElaB/YqjD/DUF883 family membrane-anchored ribosome-binding protein
MISGFKLLKKIIYYYPMELSTLTKEEKASIFEIVNNMFLHYKGNKKKETKKSFKNTWKEDNNCFQLIMTLYNAEDILDGVKGKLNEEINGGWIPAGWETEKVSWRKYRGMCIHLGEEIHELEQKLEDVEQGKGYVSEEKYKEDMKTQLEESQETIRDLSDKVAKWRNKSVWEEEKRVAEVKTAEKLTLYFKTQLEQLSKNKD